MGIILITVCIVCCNINTAYAIPVEDPNEKRMIFGGITIDINETYNNSIDSENLSSIAHIFTATWCNPCVEVEHAIEDVANETNLTMLTFHRFAGETEDPFGTENAENWWKEWFNDVLPLQPTAIINGDEPFIGANQGSYENIYEKATEKPNSKFVGNPIISVDYNPDSAVFEWSISEISNNCDEVKTFVNFVEDVAYFPNGSNGLKNYSHIVHHVKEISGESGTADLTQKLAEINAYDGNDLKLVIAFGCSIFDKEEAVIDDNSNDSPLPHIGLIPTIITIVSASMVILRRNKFQSIN